MEIKRTITSVLGSRTRTRRCAGCSLTFDREPPNCPACGSAEIEERPKIG